MSILALGLKPRAGIAKPISGLFASLHGLMFQAGIPSIGRPDGYFSARHKFVPGIRSLEFLAGS